MQHWLIEISKQLGGLLARMGDTLFHLIPGLQPWQPDGGVSLPHLAVSLMALLFVWLSSSLTRTLNQKNARWNSARNPDHWASNLLGAFFKTAGLVIWPLGTYLATSPLLVDVSPAGDDSAFRWGAMIVKAMGFIACFWFLFQLAGIIRLRLIGYASRSENSLDDTLFPLMGQTLQDLVPLAGFVLAIHYFDFPFGVVGLLEKSAAVWLIHLIALGLIRLVGVIDRLILTRYRVDATDNLAARRIHTQVKVLQKIAYVVICVFAVATSLMLFDNVRNLGASILASAGVVGIIFGFAAQHMISNLFAGIQIAVTQPIRIDDVVVVEGEWGRIEEIALTYVVVAIWDQRRLILPISYFNEKPFQNWTRRNSQILGSIFLYADYTLPVDDLRAELQRLAEANPLWDKRVCNLQITDSTERTMQIRALVSAADSGKAWDLRCELREKLIRFIQNRHPASLPRFRAEIPVGTV